MSKKVLFIGDVHGLSEWKELALGGMQNFYEIVFLGDYIDSFFVKSIDQIENLKNIIAFKKMHPEITLLLGNHDFAVIHGYSHISGYQYTFAHEYKRLFQDNINLFTIAWGYTDSKGKYTLATHAGLIYEYWKRFILPEFKKVDSFLNKIVGKQSLSDLPIHEVLNYLKDKKDILWRVGHARGGIGCPSPLWADYREFLEDAYPNINQVFGHTPKVSVTIDHNGDDFYACVDSWGNKKIASLLINL